MYEQVTVKETDHTSRIAAAYGLPSWEVIWHDPKNSGLRQQRRDQPHILFRGDKVFVPRRSARQESGSTGQSHSFRRKSPQLVLRIDVRQFRDNENGDQPCELYVDGVPRAVTPQGGLIEAEIPVDTVHAILRMDNRRHPLLVGGLDPIDESSGQKQRLYNLGYLMEVDTNSTTKPQDFEAAVYFFQDDHDLVTDAICGPLTQARLVEVYGC